MTSLGLELNLKSHAYISYMYVTFCTISILNEAPNDFISILHDNLVYTKYKHTSVCDYVSDKEVNNKQKQKDKGKNKKYSKIK